MKKLWFKEQAYRLTDEQVAEMNADLKTKLVHPHGTGKQPVKDSEDICVQWLEAKKIKPVAVLLVLVVVCAILDELFFQGDTSAYAQLLLAALTTGAGVNTVTPAQSQMESDILIGDIDTSQPLQGLKVNVDGDTTIDVQGSQPLISVLSKLSQFLCGSTVGMLLKIATGRVFCKAGVVTFTNGGATTPAVYWNSQRGVGTPGRLIRARSTTINPNSNQTFNSGDYAYLAVTNPTNVSSFDFTFADGTQQNMTVVEADALFAKTNETEANGRLDAVVTCIDNTRKNIASVRINVGAAAVTIMTVL